MNAIGTQTEAPSDYLTLSQAARCLPGKPSPTTIWRWMTAGVHGVKLQTICVGRIRYTTRAWLDEFLTATTAAADAKLVSAQHLQPSTKPNPKGKRSTTTVEKLKAAGVLE
jgi:hypothetical protein